MQEYETAKLWAVEDKAHFGRLVGVAQSLQESSMGTNYNCDLASC